LPLKTQIENKTNYSMQFCSDGESKNAGYFTGNYSLVNEESREDSSSMCRHNLWTWNV